MESRISGFQVPTVSRLILDFSCSNECRSRCVEVAVSEFIPMVKVVSNLALAKGSKDGKVLLHGEL